MQRESWDAYFLRIAKEVSTRATCDRLHVGSVIVSESRHILATGYNGSVKGMPHCDDSGHLMVEGRCKRTVHSEMNAIAQAARNGVRIDGATIYVTASPCQNCFNVIANAGIKRIVFAMLYRETAIFDWCRDTGIQAVHLEVPSEQ